MTKQPSTEFIRLALRMINPEIKDSEVFTAIKNALKARDELYEFARRRPPQSFVGLLQAFARFQEQRKQVRKKSE